MRQAIQILGLISFCNVCISQTPAIHKTWYNGDSCYVHHYYNGHLAYYKNTKKNGLEITKFPFDGKWVELDSDAQTKISSFFEVKNGLPNGIYLRYWDTGEIKDSGQYLNGAKSGLWSLRMGEHKSGQYTSYGNYSPVDTFYFNPGQSDDDYKDGLWIYKNYFGMILTKEFYKKGLRDSIWTSYHSNGRMASLEYYKNGLRDSVWTSYHSNGKMQSQEQFKNGKPYGEFYEWTEDGVLQTRLTYLDNGNCIMYYNSGEKLAEGELSWFGEYRIKTGEWTHYYKNGTVNAKGSYKFFHQVLLSYVPHYTPSSDKFGTWTYWNQNGNTIATGKYKLECGILPNTNISSCYSKMIGKWTYFDDQGNKVSYKNFKNIELLEIK